MAQFRRLLSLRITVTFTCMMLSQVSIAGDWGLSLGIASDYLMRGVSRNLGDPTLHGNADFSADSGFHASLWVSQADFIDGSTSSFDDDVEWEVNAVAGFGRGDEKLAWDISFGDYRYPGADGYVSYDYQEWHAQLVLNNRFSISLGWSDNYTLYTKTGFYTDTTAVSAELATSFALGWADIDAGVGYLDGHRGLPVNYLYGHLAATRRFGTINLDAGLYATDGRGRDQFGSLAGLQFVVGISAAF